MPRYTKGDLVVETANAIYGVRLKASGFVESKARTKAVKVKDEAPQEPTSVPDAPVADSPVL